MRRALVADALPDDFTFELRERQQNFQHEPAHRGGRVELLRDGYERDPVTLEDFHDESEVEQRSPESIDLVNELRKLAAAKMAQEKPGHTLEATALVHEAYLRLTGSRSYESQSHFLRVAAESMRRILVDHARARSAAKRGGGRRVELESDCLAIAADGGDLEALDEALSKLAVTYPQQAELVQMRFFGGLTLDECAETLGVSARTADTWWAYARAWLAVEIRPPDTTEADVGE